MKRLDYTLTGSWRLLTAPPRLDFTRSGHWRVLPPEVAEALDAEDTEAVASAGPRESGVPCESLEVRDIDPAKWDEIAPLFQRSQAAPG